MTPIFRKLSQTKNERMRDHIKTGNSGKAIVLARLCKVGYVVTSHTSSGWKKYRRGSATPVIKQLCKCCCAHGKRTGRKETESKGFGGRWKPRYCARKQYYAQHKLDKICSARYEVKTLKDKVGRPQYQRFPARCCHENENWHQQKNPRCRKTKVRDELDGCDNNG